MGKEREPNRLIPGALFTFPYPFVEDEYSDGSDGPSTPSPCWKPGIRFEDRGECHQALADAVGSQTVTIVATFKPGRYPERIFFTRKWTDPDGKSFGKSNLHTKTRAGFTRLISGYRHEFDIAGQPPTRMEQFCASFESPASQPESTQAGSADGA